MVLLVEKRNRSILLSIIKSEIEPRITIHSDQWKAYMLTLNQHGFIHRTATHSEFLVNFDTRLTLKRSNVYGDT